jgi:chromosome segregation ATPase
MAVSTDRAAAPDSAAIDVAEAAALTGLSKAAIRGRIRRGALASDVQDGRRRIPLAELQRQGLLVDPEQHANLLERAEALEADLRAAFESREQAQQELRELQDTLRMVWSMVRQLEQDISHLQAARAERGSIRWPWRRGPWRRSASPATDSA